MTGRLIVLSGPSGVGKDTVIDRWAERNPRVWRVIACTTRAPRQGEVDGVDYHFLSTERFHEMARAGRFLEHKEVHGNWYATPLDDMEAALSEGKICLLKIDVQGAMEVAKLRRDALMVFLEPPSMEELERRIRSRNQDSPEQIERRLTTARQEMAAAAAYRYRIVNTDVEATVDALEAIARNPD